MAEHLDGMKQSVLERTNGELTLGRRHWLWNELARRHPTDNEWRRAVLGFLVCDETVAAWENLSLEPTDRRLYHKFRALCRSVLLGEVGHKAAREELINLDSHGQSIDFSGDWIGHFALGAVRAACFDAIHPVSLDTPINIELADVDIDPDDLDAHFLVSCVRTGGTTWDPSSDHSLRRAFWINWLENLAPLGFLDASELQRLVSASGAR